MTRFLLTAAILISVLSMLVGCGATDAEHAAEGGHSATHPEPERIEHFKGLDAPDWATAVAHLVEYNQQLRAVVAQESLTHEDMDTVHQLTYTLENAVERIQQDLVVLADALEEVHQASETDDEARLRSNAAIYFEYTQRLLQQ
ncbi:MAG: hypothetical protein EA401_05285 [Planctomycetota bacterium]|nr:MAG: hypothetical protein EA401_05285 [Planctomycetota bacterium]